jgi:hypothetical protein
MFCRGGRDRRSKGSPTEVVHLVRMDLDPESERFCGFEDTPALGY